MWQFSSDFADSQRTRLERLTAWRSYGEIVDAVIATSVVVPRSVIWKQRDKVPTEAHRIEFKVDADRDVVDVSAVARNRTYSAVRARLRFADSAWLAPVLC